MTSAAELLQTHRAQAGLDTDDALALLVDFFNRSDMAETAIDVFCDCLDDEGMTDEFASLLMEHGLVIDPPDASLEDDEGLG